MLSDIHNDLQDKLDTLDVQAVAAGLEIDSLKTKNNGDGVTGHWNND